MHAFGAGLLILVQVSPAVAQTEIVFPATGSVRICGHGSQLHPVVNRDGKIAYQRWGLDGSHDTVVRDAFDQPELVLAPPACGWLAASTELLACIWHPSDDAGFVGKGSYSDWQSIPQGFTPASEMRISSVAIWDDGGTSDRMAASYFDQGRWNIYLARDVAYGNQPGDEDFRSSGDLLEPAVEKYLIVWVERQRWERADRQWAIYYAHWEEGYTSRRFLGYGRHPSVLQLPGSRFLIAFEAIGGPAPTIEVHEVVRPGQTVKLPWEPACEAARRPILNADGQVLYACWDPDEEDWFLTLGVLDAPECKIVVDRLGHFPEEDEPPQYHGVGNYVAYSKLDSETSTRFGVWINEREAVEVGMRCREWVECMHGAPGFCYPPQFVR